MATNFFKHDTVDYRGQSGEIIVGPYTDDDGYPAATVLWSDGSRSEIGLQAVTRVGPVLPQFFDPGI